MEGAGVVSRSAEHPELISSHHWSQRQIRGVFPYDHLPLDPRNWDRGDVESWLEMMSTKHRIKELKKERFLMNGKALCLMTVDMYLDRVPLGGKLLYRDFQIRLARAMYL